MPLPATPEYVTDVPYVRNFHPDLSPARLRLVAALNGFPSPPADDFDYCELGSAQGDTTATLAAAYPRARFVGVDLNPEHIAVASELASAGGLTNVRFVERDFEDLDRDAFPQFDFIAAHGVLSWVGEAKRKAVLAFAAAKLKPGGLLYVGYNALPGWAAVEPLRHLIADRAAAVQGGSLERARQALDFAKVMRDGAADYFKNNPPAEAMLATMEKLGLRYVVHEYLHAHWVPMYFTQVAREMAESDLYFIGQLPLHLNYRDLAIPPSLAPLFKTIEDRVTFESLKDFAVNEYFRRDVYVKGRVARSEAATQAYFDTTAFGTLLEGPIAREVRLPYYTLGFVGAIFDALIPALAEGAATAPALARLPSLATFGAPRVRDALLRLALGNQVAPMQEASRGALAESESCRVPLAYNRMILQQRLSNESPIVLASPVAGTGLSIPLLQAVAMRLLTEVPQAEWQSWIRALFRKEPLRLKVGDRAIDEDEQERMLLEEVREFRAKRLPKLRELGILA